MAEVGIECPSCGHLAPPGSNRCPNCNGPLRLGGNRTQIFRGDPELAELQSGGESPAPGARAREDALPPRDAGRFRVALREPDGDYEPGRVLSSRAVPGAELTLIARIHNQTRVVDNFDLSVEGLPDEWISIRPATVYLTPRDAGRGDHEQEVEVRIRPPRTSEAAVGERAVSVVAVSRATGARETADLNLSIEPFAKLTAGLRPAELRSRYRARTRLSVKNEGNGPAYVKLAGVDPTGKLRFKFTPDELRVADEDEARIEVRPPRRIWIGRPKTHQFTVEARAATGDDAVSEHGRLDHRPYLPPWVLLIVPLILAAFAWYLQRPEQGTVPVVTNTTLREAAQRVTQAGLRPEFKAIPARNQSRPAPRVIDQSPAPDEKVNVDEPVLIIFEQGIGTRPVPAVVDMTVREARATLEDAGFQLGQVLPVDAPPGGKIAVQEPPAGEPLARRLPVSVTLDPADEITAGTVGGAATSPATPAEEGEGVLAVPLAYSDGHQIFIKDPGKGPVPVAGDAESDNTEPTWNPVGKTVAFVHALSRESSEIRSVKPGARNSIRALTDRDNRYGAPAYSPEGTLLALIDIDPDNSEFGGQLCLMATRSGKPTCREDDGFYYYRPAWGDETTLYVLRRRKDPPPDQPSGWTQIARFTAEEPGGTAADSWTADVKPVVRADVQSVAIGPEGKIAALTRKSANDAYTISIYDPNGSESAKQPRGLALCNLSWSGKDLVAMVSECAANSPQGMIGKFDPDDLAANVEKIVSKGRDPALAPAG